MLRFLHIDDTAVLASAAYLRYMGQLNILLQKVGDVLVKARLSDEEAEARGERFNIFSLVGANHYETTHSAIIAEFLYPDGSHGYGTLFRIDKVSCLTKSGVLFDIASAKVCTEYDTGSGRIDIKNESGQVVIIENKIYASDQPEQLKRYAEFADSRKWDYAIIYLTLYGNEASNQSAGGADYLCISYSDDILNWLHRCIIACADKTLLVGTLTQYSNLIKKLTNQDMETRYSEEIIMAMADNADAVAAICNAQRAYQEYFIKQNICPKVGGVCS